MGFKSVRSQVRFALDHGIFSGMKIYLARWVSLDVESNLKRMESEASQAAADGAGLVIFPESFLHGYKRSVDPLLAREHFHSISMRYPQTLFLFGSFSEKRRNRMTLWLQGREIAWYDKIHLFAPNGEYELWDPGEGYTAVTTQGITFGLINCNDLRFPEQARTLKLQSRCQVFLVVAWWPWRRDHVWRTLLRARAIENAAWVLGCCVAASEIPEERFSGAGNYIFDPAGTSYYPVLGDTTYDLDLAMGPPLSVDPVKSYVEVNQVRHFQES
jgi:predicted amidohydrolase